MAVSTAIGARKYTSAKCAVPQSTTVTVTRLRSAGGRSATHSPTCRSIHFSVREPDVAGEAGPVAAAAAALVGPVGGAVPDVEPAWMPFVAHDVSDATANGTHNAGMLRTRITAPRSRRIAVKSRHPGVSEERIRRSQGTFSANAGGTVLVRAGSGFSDDIDSSPRTQRAASSQYAGFFQSRPPKSCLIMVSVSK